MWDAPRLGEDFDVVGIITHGRVIFCMGRGYHTREVETFGAPMLEPEANRELCEEPWAMLMQACHQESCSHPGKP